MKLRVSQGRDEALSAETALAAFDSALAALPVDSQPKAKKALEGPIRALMAHVNLNVCLFHVAQGLKGIGLNGADPNIFRPIAEKFLEIAQGLGHGAGEDPYLVWAAFEEAYRRVRAPFMGLSRVELLEGLRRAADEPSTMSKEIAALRFDNSPTMARVLAVLEALSLFANAGEFFLSVRMLAQAVGLQDTQFADAALALRRAEESGVIEPMAEATRYRARHWRWLGLCSEAQPARAAGSERARRRGQKPDTREPDIAHLDHYLRRVMPARCADWNKRSPEQQRRQATAAWRRDNPQGAEANTQAGGNGRGYGG